MQSAGLMVMYSYIFVISITVNHRSINCDIAEVYIAISALSYFSNSPPQVPTTIGSPLPLTECSSV